MEDKASNCRLIGIGVTAYSFLLYIIIKGKKKFMRDINRIPSILQQIEKIWRKYPDMRLGQLICNVLRDPTLYYTEDQELVDFLKAYYKIED